MRGSCIGSASFWCMGRSRTGSAVSPSPPLSRPAQRSGPEIFRFWRSLGINLKQLYGQTEASVYITAQPDGEIYADTVGKPNIGVDVKIAENGEVLFKSPGVFVGYYKDPQQTVQTKTPDG